MIPQPSQPLRDLVSQAFDHAVRSIVNTNGPLVPFAIIETSAGQRAMARFTGGRNPEEARQAARAQVGQLGDCVKYAIAADGSVMSGTQHIPVIMVEAGERSAAHGYSFIQRFASTPACRFAQPVQDPSIIDYPAVLKPGG